MKNEVYPPRQRIIRLMVEAFRMVGKHVIGVLVSGLPCRRGTFPGKVRIVNGGT